MVTNELMGHCQHHVAHHAKATPHSNESMWSKILIVHGFMRYGSSLMMPIKT
jgi:hypothetical protein